MARTCTTCKATIFCIHSTCADCRQKDCKHINWHYDANHVKVCDVCGLLIPNTKPKGCKEPGCEGLHVAQGYCNKHYQRHFRKGTITKIREIATKEDALYSDVSIAGLVIV